VSSRSYSRLCLVLVLAAIGQVSCEDEERLSRSEEHRLEPTAAQEESSEPFCEERGQASKGSTSDMARIPGGRFVRGAEDGAGSMGSEVAREIVLGPFLLDRYEVTAGEFRECVETGVCEAPSTEGDCTYGSSNPNLPVSCVPWSQARAYCCWLGKRLPTSAEWERAAKRFPPQKGPRDGAYMQDAPLPVGSYDGDVSLDGVHDLYGNMSEWVFDWFSYDYYEWSRERNPRGPAVSPFDAKVTRGASWDSIYSSPDAISSIDIYDPAEFAEFRDGLGFRCAKSVDDAEP